MKEKDGKKIAVFTYRFPFPDNDGAKIRVVNFINSIYKNVDIYLFSLTFTPISMDNYNEALRFCKEVHIFKINKFMAILKLPFTFLFSKKPIQSIFFNNKLMKKAVKNTCFDIIYFNTVRTMTYSKYLKTDTSVLDFVDAISMNYSQKKEKSNLLMTLFYYFEHKRLLKFELSSQKSIDKFIIISDVDKNYLINNGFDKNIEIIGNYVKDIELKKYTNKIEHDNFLTFMGKMSYEPNVSAIMTYIEKIEPDLSQLAKDLKLIVIGSGASSKLVYFASKRNVHFTGFVEDPYEIIIRSKLFIAPMVSGAGIQNKILEAMYIGKCVVTTKLGSEGLTNLKGDEIVVLNDIESFSQVISQLVKDEKKLLEIGSNAHIYVEKYFSKQGIAKKYMEVLEI